MRQEQKRELKIPCQPKDQEGFGKKMNNSKRMGQPTIGKPVRHGAKEKKKQKSLTAKKPGQVE